MNRDGLKVRHALNSTLPVIKVDHTYNANVSSDLYSIYRSNTSFLYMQPCTCVTHVHHAITMCITMHMCNPDLDCSGIPTTFCHRIC